MGRWLIAKRRNKVKAAKTTTCIAAYLEAAVHESFSYAVGEGDVGQKNGDSLEQLQQRGQHLEVAADDLLLQ